MLRCGLQSAICSGTKVKFKHRGACIEQAGNRMRKRSLHRVIHLSTLSQAWRAAPRRSSAPWWRARSRGSRCLCPAVARTAATSRYSAMKVQSIIIKPAVRPFVHPSVLSIGKLLKHLCMYISTTQTKCILDLNVPSEVTMSNQFQIHSYQTKFQSHLLHLLIILICLSTYRHRVLLVCG